jgi:hypothetical protein
MYVYYNHKSLGICVCALSHECGCQTFVLDFPLVKRLNGAFAPETENGIDTPLMTKIEPHRLDRQPGCRCWSTDGYVSVTTAMSTRTHRVPDPTQNMCFLDASDADVSEVEGQADRTTFLTIRPYRIVYIPTHVLDRIDANSLFLSTLITV